MQRVRKEHLKEILEKLEPEEHAQIFDVIKRHTTDYTRTQNGVLVSSDALTDECLFEIETMANYYMDQRKRMDVETASRRALAKGAQNGRNQVRQKE
jgi:hypothetical protein